MLWFLMLLGNIINIGYKIRKDVNKDTNIFSFIPKWFSNAQNFLYTVLGLLTSIALILMVDFSAMGEFELLGIKFYWPYTIAVFIGVTNQWLFDKVVNGIKKR